jgi:hypothetical protein
MNVRLMCNLKLGKGSEFTLVAYNIKVPAVLSLFPADGTAESRSADLLYNLRKSALSAGKETGSLENKPYIQGAAKTSTAN